MQMEQAQSEERVESDRSLLSMVADTMVARPQAHANIRKHLLRLSDPQSRQALQRMIDEFERVQWSRFDELGRVWQIEQIIGRFRAAGDETSLLAERALVWGLSNRPKQRVPMAKPASRDVADDIEALIEG